MLTMEDVIEHCKRKVFRMETFFGEEKLKSMGCENDIGKEYWEHKNVLGWLEDLKRIKENIAFVSSVPIEDIVLNARAEERQATIDEFEKALLTNDVVDRSVVRRVASQLRSKK